MRCSAPLPPEVEVALGGAMVVCMPMVSNGLMEADRRFGSVSACCCWSFTGDGDDAGNKLKLEAVDSVVPWNTGDGGCGDMVVRRGEPLVGMDICDVGDDCSRG